MGEVVSYVTNTPMPTASPFCQVVTADGGRRPHHRLRGAENFAAGDRVIVALPGAVLPGDFKIKERANCAGRRLRGT